MRKNFVCQESKYRKRAGLFDEPGEVHLEETDQTVSALKCLFREF